MNTITLTVNGEARSASVAPRTQLAEVLRDHLHLTGTHLGCEQGVCGACTVLVDGRPIRSCITYAHACNGATVVTVEGLRDDPVGAALRSAFSRHHALQCGFCTSGMLIAAWDIVTRVAPPSEARVRHELSGNLCRCTGYMGIVAAVREVALAHAGKEAGDPAPPEVAPINGAAFEPFEVDATFMAAAGGESGPTKTMTQSDGWSLVEREFTLRHPIAASWALFEDLPRIAPCIPGVSIESADASRFAGRAAIRFGPISAAFEAEGTRHADPEQRVGTISGHGKDPRGHATLEAELSYAMSQPDDPATPSEHTRVDLAIRFRIQGGLAQFNRADLVESFADAVLAEFVQNFERLLAGEKVRSRASISGVALLWRMIKAKLGG